jgi:hypothetical protein
MLLETTRAGLTMFGAMLVFAAAFSFAPRGWRRKLARVALVVVFMCAIGNLTSGVAYGHRPIGWPTMMLIIAVAISAWLTFSPYLLRPKADDNGGAKRPAAA